MSSLARKLRVWEISIWELTCNSYLKPIPTKRTKAICLERLAGCKAHLHQLQIFQLFVPLRKPKDCGYIDGSTKWSHMLTSSIPKKLLIINYQGNQRMIFNFQYLKHTAALHKTVISLGSTPISVVSLKVLRAFSFEEKKSHHQSWCILLHLHELS